MVVWVSKPASPFLSKNGCTSFFGTILWNTSEDLNPQYMSLYLENFSGSFARLMDNKRNKIQVSVFSQKIAYASHREEYWHNSLSKC